MISYTDTLTIIDLVGNKSELSLCRIEGGNKIFSKDTHVVIKKGCKIVKNHSDGWSQTYLVLEPPKINLLGSLDISVKEL